MALPSTGSISLSQVAVELSRPATAQTALGEAAVRNLGGLPSGAIGLINLRGKSAAIIYTATNLASLNLATAFGADYSAAVDKRLVVPAGITLGPVTIPTGLGGTLTVENAGEIQGLGGAANGGAGGDAITASVSFTLLNAGAVRGGGGGGGLGGTGGQGSVSSTTSDWVRRVNAGIIPVNDASATSNGWFCDRFFLLRNDRGIRSRIYITNAAFLNLQLSQILSQFIVSNVALNTLYDFTPGQSQDLGNPPGPILGVNYSYIDDFVSSTSTTFTSGGAGGAGGRGRGYGQTNAARGSGASGGTNEGTGGAGGAGGVWGQAGARGSAGANGNHSSGTAGGSGGAAGRAVRMLAGSLTLTNSGTINGAT